MKNRLLSLKRQKATQILTDKNKPIDQRYRLWYNEIENAARQTIGKTTIKEGKQRKMNLTNGKQRKKVIVVIPK